jgi:hypothetical protein
METKLTKEECLLILFRPVFPEELFADGAPGRIDKINELGEKIHFERSLYPIRETPRNIRQILLILVRQAKPGQSSELKGAHHVIVRLTCSCPIAGRGNPVWCEASGQRRREP